MWLLTLWWGLAGGPPAAQPLFDPPTTVALAVFKDDASSRCTLHRVGLDGVIEEIMTLPGSCPHETKAYWNPDGGRFALEMVCSNEPCLVIVDRLEGITVNHYPPDLDVRRAGFVGGSLHVFGRPVIRPPGTFSQVKEWFGLSPACTNDRAIAVDSFLKAGTWRTAEVRSAPCSGRAYMRDLKNWHALESGVGRDFHTVAMTMKGSGIEYIRGATGNEDPTVEFLPTARGFVTLQYQNHFGFFDTEGTLSSVLVGREQQGCIVAGDRLEEWSGYFLYRPGEYWPRRGPVVVLDPNGKEVLSIPDGLVTFWPTPSVTNSTPPISAGSAARHFSGVRYDVEW